MNAVCHASKRKKVKHTMKESLSKGCCSLRKYYKTNKVNKLPGKKKENNAHTHTHSDTQRPTDTPRDTHTHTLEPASNQGSAVLHKHLSHTFTHTLTHSHTHTFTHSHTHTHTHSLTHRHTYSHSA